MTCQIVTNFRSNIACPVKTPLFSRLYRLRSLYSRHVFPTGCVTDRRAIHELNEFEPPESRSTSNCIYAAKYALFYFYVQLVCGLCPTVICFYGTFKLWGRQSGFGNLCFEGPNVLGSEVLILRLR